MIAGLLAVEALLATAFALWPPAPANRVLDSVLAVVLIMAALGCALRPRERGSLGLVEACLVVAWGLPLVFVATRRLEPSQLLWGMILLLVAVVAAFYLPRRAATYQVLALTTGYFVAVLILQPDTRLLYVAGVVICIAVSSFAITLLRSDRDRVLKSVAALATTDPLTGLLNRRGLEAQASVVRAISQRSGRPTTVAMLDLDGLKQVNDTHGHRAGDRLIATVAAHWRSAMREGDLVARVGGDEFVVILPQTTDADAAEMLDRMRAEAPGPWSQGWTVWQPGESLADAVGRADARMFAEKVERRGRGTDTREA